PTKHGNLRSNGSPTPPTASTASISRTFVAIGPSTTYSVRVAAKACGLNTPKKPAMNSTPTPPSPCSPNTSKYRAAKRLDYLQSIGIAYKPAGARPLPVFLLGGSSNLHFLGALGVLGG